MKKITITLLAAMGLFAWSCTDEPTVEESKEDVPPQEEEEYIPENLRNTLAWLHYSMTDEEKDANKSINTYSLFLIDQINKADKGNGFVLSPVTETMLTMMIANGADEAYRQKVLEIMGHDNMDALNSYGAKLIEALPEKNNGAFLTMANGLWADNDIKIADYYAAMIKENFGAECTNLDFGSAASADLINDWCKRTTMGLIPQIIDSKTLSSADVLLASTLFFCGEWAHKFDKSLTKEADFTTPTGVVKVQMMHRDWVPSGYYKENDGYVYAASGFSGGSRFQIVLPPEDKPLSEAISDMPEEIIDLITLPEVLYTEDRLHLELPRFSCASSINFTDIYGSIGLYPSALPGLNMPVVTNFKSLQKASIKLDEDGATAGAASYAAATGASGVYVPKDYYVTADRPFYFFITNNYTGTVIFAGLITNP